MDVACDPHPRVSRRSWILLLTLSALWGSSYLFIKLALEDDVSPAVIVSVRTALAALVLLPLAAHRGALGGLRANVAPILLLAVVQMGGPLLLIAAGEQHISSSLTGILVATAPIFTFLLAFAQEGQERASGLSLGGVAIGIGGVALLLGLDTSGGAALAGGLMVVAASFGYGIGGWVVKRQVRDVQPVAMVGATASVAALLTAPAALLSSALPYTGLRGRLVAARARRALYRCGLRDLLFARVERRPGARLARRLHRARLQRGLRRDAARRELHRS